MTRRLTYAALGLAVGALAVVVVIRAGFGAALGLAIFCAVAPDFTMLIGFRSSLARGQLSPKAVPFYNAVHRVWGPLALVVLYFLLYVLGIHQLALLAGGLAWLTHVAVDRTFGFGLRDQAGFQRQRSDMPGGTRPTTV